MKTHVRGFLTLISTRSVGSLQPAEWVLSSTDRMKIIVKEAIQNGFLF